MGGKAERDFTLARRWNAGGLDEWKVFTVRKW